MPDFPFKTVILQANTVSAGFCSCIPILKLLDSLVQLNVADNLIQVIENGAFVNMPRLRTIYLERNILTHVSAIYTPHLSSVFLDGNMHLIKTQVSNSHTLLKTSPPPPPGGGGVTAFGGCTRCTRIALKKVYPKRGFNGIPKETLNKSHGPISTF